MRFKFKGSVGKQELLEKFAEVLNSLEDAGVNEFQGVNLYFNPCISGVKVIPHLNGIQCDLASDSTQQHMETTTDDKGKKTISYITGVKGSDMNLDGRIPYKPVITLPTAQELKEREQAQRKLEREAMEKSFAEAAEKRKLKQEAELAEKKLAQGCIAVLREKLGLSEDEFKHERSSDGWIKTEKGIAKYDDKICESKVYRISMKIKDSKSKKVYLFSEASILLYEGVH
ncbi:hypothetical protein DDM98_10065 [Vibrio cholerae]|uniref:Uncharacterized protein n=1 Tax=Vibrio fluvialis PG41 TaxID=1336752 RepID=S7HY50_VIBFL|nr:hypothetical protein [Vibrio fluvialis]EGR4260834.1 hypothetical protein [Vibrio cholerae]EPP20699.1 hypothetical protein L910_1815 [Vibrio fluvialis PG41]